MPVKGDGMKKIIFISWILIALFSFAGCEGKPYELKNSVDKIGSIEIVSAENSLDYTVIKMLSETEISEFIEKLQKIKFDSYLIGDPMSVNGNAVRIAYQNGDYEMICYYWAEYVKNGEINYVRRSCDENEFNELIDSFSE